MSHLGLTCGTLERREEEGRTLIYARNGQKLKLLSGIPFIPRILWTDAGAKPAYPDLLSVSFTTANIYCKSCNLSNTDVRNNSIDLR